MAAKFTPERRERLLTLIENGRTVRDAAADVGISQTTVGKWAARGRADGTQEEVTFAERFDAAREGKSGRRLSHDDLIRLLETAARKGSVQAIRLLLERPWEETRGTDTGQDDEDASKTKDPFAELDELAPRRKQGREGA